MINFNWKKINSSVIKIFYIIFTMIIGWIIIGTLIIPLIKSFQLKENFNQTQKGDTEKTVITKIGSPDLVVTEKLGDSYFWRDNYTANGTEGVYAYFDPFYFFPIVYFINLDENGIVIEKNYWTSW